MFWAPAWDAEPSTIAATVIKIPRETREQRNSLTFRFMIIRLMRLAVRSTRNGRYKIQQISCGEKWAAPLSCLGVCPRLKHGNRFVSILQPKLWELASGTSTRLLKFVQPPQTFDESFEFDHEIELADRLQNKSGRS